MLCVLHEPLSQIFQTSSPPFPIYLNPTFQIGPSCLLTLDTTLLPLQPNNLYPTSHLTSPDLNLTTCGIQLLVYKRLQCLHVSTAHEPCYAAPVYLHIGPLLMTSREAGARLGPLCVPRKGSSA